MDLLEEARKGSRVYAITFPDGKRIPFRLLSWQDYTAFHRVLSQGALPEGALQEAIFRECCLDSRYVDDVNDLRAGVVPTIADTIMHMSGPNSPEEFNVQMDSYREATQSLLGQVVMIICRAFPGYTPDDLGKMDWPALLERLAQAEAILMSKNPPEITEPVRMLTEADLKKKDKLGRAGKMPAGLSSEMISKDLRGLQELDRPDSKDAVAEGQRIKQARTQGGTEMSPEARRSIREVVAKRMAERSK